MEIRDLLKNGHEIWGDKKLTLSEIIVRMGKVYGDICRWERNAEKDKLLHADEELKKNSAILFFQLLGGATILTMTLMIALTLQLSVKRNIKSYNKDIKIKNSLS